MKPRVFLPAVVTGPLLWAAFFPLDLGPLAYVALVPWLTLVRAPVSNRRRYFAAYLGGLAFFLPALQWVRVAHPMMYLSWVGLAIACAAFWVLALWLVRRLDRLGAPLALSVPAVWVTLEYVRGHFPTGFPVLQHLGLYQMAGFGWYFLGYTQHEFLPLIQVADLGGVYAVSVVVAAVNGLACEWLLRSETVRSWLGWAPQPNPPTPFPDREGGENAGSASSPPRPGEGLGEGSSRRPSLGRLVPCSVAVAAVFAAAVVYGFVRLDHPGFRPGPRVAAIQGSVGQDEKNLKGNTLEVAYGQLHARAAADHPDLIVWPETCFVYDWLWIAPGAEPPEAVRAKEAECHRFFASMPWGAPVLLGLGGLEWDDGRVWKYNTAVLLSRDGRHLGRYDKMHLVPFGEYVPFKETLPFMTTFTPYKWDYSCRPGEHWTRFPLRTADGRSFTFACLICYEDSDPYLARQYARMDAYGAQSLHFLVNISNDGWFNGTEEHEEHLAICRFRAVEARRSVVRAVNMGISGVIDPDGRVIAIPGDSWSASKKVEAVVTAVVPIDSRTSWYARLGDWVPGVCGLLTLLGLVASVVIRRQGTTT